MSTNRRKHIRLNDPGASYSYTAYGSGGGPEFRRPPRDRVRHAQKLRGDLNEAERVATERGFSKGGALVIAYELQPHAIEVVDSLERLPSGIQLLSVSTNSAQIRATVRVPANKVKILHRILNRYETELDKRSQRPKGQDLVENVDAIRLATERDLWTDNVPFPEPSQPSWWEIWLCHDQRNAPETTYEEFRRLAEVAELSLRERFIVFPDRLVTVGFGRFDDWVREPPTKLIRSFGPR